MGSARVVGTLRAGAAGGGGNVPAFGAIAGRGRVSVTTAFSRSVMQRRASCWLVVRGAKGAAGEGLRRACRMSWMPRRMRSLEEDVVGIGIFVCSQVKVLQMRIAREVHIHTM